MDIQELTQEMHRFVSRQGWYQDDSLRPQSAKNLAASLMIECGEVVELVQWTDQPADRQALAGELADVALYLLQLANTAGIDLEDAVLQKLAHNYGRRWDQDSPPRPHRSAPNE